MRKSQPEVPAGGEIFKVIGDWTLYRTGPERFRLVANGPVEGRANYALAIENDQLQQTLDYPKLQKHPELLAQLEAGLKGVEAITVDNAYGDLAVKGGRALSNEQRWQRHLVHIRRLWLEHQAFALESAFLVDAAITVRFQPLFERAPSQDEIDSAKAFVLRGGKPDEAALLAVEREYYDGKYGVKAMEQLAIQFDIITGALL